MSFVEKIWNESKNYLEQQKKLKIYWNGITSYYFYLIIILIQTTFFNGLNFSKFYYNSLKNPVGYLKFLSPCNTLIQLQIALNSTIFSLVALNPL